MSRADRCVVIVSLSSRLLIITRPRYVNPFPFFYVEQYYVEINILKTGQTFQMFGVLSVVTNGHLSSFPKTTRWTIFMCTVNAVRVCLSRVS
jgi:hypothetical protein